MFILVRHAHAGGKKRWEGPDLHRPLNRRGKQEAEDLARNLHAMPVSRLLSSPALRCIQTLAPLAVRLGRPTATRHALRPDTPAAELDGFLGAEDVQGAVLCTHGETISALLQLWGRRRVLLPDPARPPDCTEKGAAWIVETIGELRILHYLHPLHVGPVLLRTRADVYRRPAVPHPRIHGAATLHVLRSRA